ncbi:hypothetical protein N7474_006393 [Penicillium riverlandense]|uniref:uncharacterized protein n=1 Tax=Penicillium riverlandense TaxID=1903569 RepID=UPI002546B0C5|nr:uncharacterized protein N7474_006393 [Penicillium riverlandense]KAJ5814616.1 hypothetical protein N7474_006393 [Penicillium riverlandense]
MFEDFSFTSPSSRPPRLTVDADDRIMLDGDSSLISPLSSRCPSPQSHRFRTGSGSRSRNSYFRSPPAPTSVPYPYEPKRLSISTLTQKLHEHSLLPAQHSHDSSPVSAAPPGSRFAGYVLTPPDTDHDEEGLGMSDHLSSPLSSSTSPTSMPLDSPDQGRRAADRSPSNGGAGLPDQLNVRMQRQRIARLQCSPAELDAIRRTVLADEEDDNCPGGDEGYHPSSLPPRSPTRRRTATSARSRFSPDSSVSASGQGTTTSHARRKSSSAGVLLPQANRVEKSQSAVPSKRSEHGLRRKSLVSAALANLVEEG